MTAQEKRIFDLTGADLLELFKTALQEVTAKEEPEPADDTIKGLGALAEYLHISKNTAWRRYQAGAFDKAASRPTKSIIYFSKKELDKIVKI